MLNNYFILIKIQSFWCFSKMFPLKLSSSTLIYVEQDFLILFDLHEDYNSSIDHFYSFLMLTGNYLLPKLIKINLFKFYLKNFQKLYIPSTLVLTSNSFLSIIV
jgi:hypothetical protein